MLELLGIAQVIRREVKKVGIRAPAAAGQRSADEQDGGADGGQGDDEPDQVEHTANTAGG